MSQTPQKYTLLARLLHWLMALMIISTLLIGVAMVSSLKNYHWLMSIHRPLGIAILLLAFIRLGNRLWNPPPPFPANMSTQEKMAATLSEYAIYVLMFAMPLVGWAMLSAARYPIVLLNTIELPFIFPQSLKWYAFLRETHTILAYLFAFIILSHFTAVLVHTYVIRDGLLTRMSLWPSGKSSSVASREDYSGSSSAINGHQQANPPNVS